MEEKTKKRLWSIFSTIQKIALVIIIAFLIRYFLIQPFIIEGNSMEPNYHDRQFILIDKISYRFNPSKHNDIIVFQNPRNPSIYYIKRIIGIPGDKIKISDGKVYRNGQIINEPYLNPSQTTTTEADNADLEISVTNNHYFVMGDNRGSSSDSREWGLLPSMNIVGRLWFVLYPIHTSSLLFLNSYEPIAMGS